MKYGSDFLRVIAGASGGVPLKAPKGQNTRPTTDRLKETLFNILQKEILGSKVLDLFAGSGSLGIEALSRGASYGVFVDKSVLCTKVIQENLIHTRLQERGHVYHDDYMISLRKFKKKEEKFHIIFLDPPYDCNILTNAVQRIKDYDLLEKEGVIVAEKSLKEVVRVEGMVVVRSKIIGISEILFLKMGNES